MWAVTRRNPSIIIGRANMKIWEIYLVIFRFLKNVRIMFILLWIFDSGQTELIIIFLKEKYKFWNSPHLPTLATIEAADPAPAPGCPAARSEQEAARISSLALKFWGWEGERTLHLISSVFTDYRVHIEGRKRTKSQKKLPKTQILTKKVKGTPVKHFIFKCKNMKSFSLLET